MDAHARNSGTGGQRPDCEAKIAVMNFFVVNCALLSAVILLCPALIICGCQGLGNKRPREFCLSTVLLFTNQVNVYPAAAWGFEQ